MTLPSHFIFQAKEERIIVLETENALLHLKLAEVMMATVHL